MLTPRFSLDQIRRKFAAARKSLDRKVIRLLQYLGEQCVAKARSLQTYQDQTGNLRASIGYLVLRDGKVVRRSFSGDTKDGASQGERYALSLTGNYPTGYALIVVAGMDYAAKVESRGLDVLTGTRQYAQAELPALIRSLTSR